MSRRAAGQKLVSSMSAPEETGRRRWNRRALRRTGRKNKEAVLSQEQVIPVPDPPCQENITLLEQCPVFLSNLEPIPDTPEQSTTRLHYPECSATNSVCEHCLYPCPSGTCTNQSCQLVSLLLTCELVTDLRSKVFGCPQFRACPKCHSLMMHTAGCKYVTCVRCGHRFCFICLRSTGKCKKDRDFYWLLICTKPRADRQRFQMGHAGHVQQENLDPVLCPLRFFNWMPVPDTSGRAMPFRQIPKCPAVKPVCEHCLYPCPSGTCTNQSCQVVSVLQTCELVTDPESDVFGCPQFRACPKCHSLIMHVGGCNYVECGQCEHEYCFICLRSADECNDEDFFPCCSLTHQAARQRFRT